MITTPTPTQWRVNRIEYDRLGELGFFASKRVQLINGQVIEMSPMGSPHATSVSLCLEFVKRIVGDGFLIRSQMPLVLGDWSEPEPDLAVIKGSVRDFEEKHPTCAELVIEVADSSLTLDRDMKSVLYAKAGVSEYWLVDMKGRCIHIFREPEISNGRYRQVMIFHEGESLSSLLNSTVVVAVSDLLPAKR